MKRWRALIWAVLAAFCLDAIGSVGQQSDSVQHLYEQAQRAMAQGRYAEAEQVYEKLSKLDAGTAEVHANLGLLYFEERKFELAVLELRQALKLKPSLVKSESLLAMSLSELGRYSEALPGLEKGFHRSSDPEIKRMCGLQLARTYTGLKRDSKAVEVALELNRLYPDDPEILYQTGKIYGNFAFLTIQKLEHAGPDSVWKHLAAAETLESQGSNSLAIEEYRKVLALEPQRPGVHYRLGRTLLARSHQANSPQDVADAAAEFEQELQISPGNANAAYELGEIRRKQANFEQAQKLFELAVNSYPEFEEAHLGLAVTLLALQKPEQALPHVLKATELNPQDEVAWYRLAQTQKMLGNKAGQQKALAEYRSLHDQANQQSGIEPVFSPGEVTRQEVDSNASQ